LLKLKAISSKDIDTILLARFNLLTPSENSPRHFIEPKEKRD
jgi:hypothetical protein